MWDVPIFVPLIREELASGMVEMSGFFTGFMNGADIRVIEGGGRLRLAEQALPCTFISHGFRWEDLDRGIAVEARVLAR